MTTTWTPPPGSTPLPDEPGWWKSLGGGIYSHPTETERLDSLRHQAAEREAKRHRQEALRVPPEVIAQLHVQGLEARLNQAYSELTEAHEREAFLEDLLAGVLSERA